MGEWIVTKEAVINGFYEEPIWDNAPFYTYTRNVTHRLYPGDICYIDDEGRVSHESHEYGMSIHPGILWLYPNKSEKEEIFGQLTEDTAKLWYALMEKKLEIEEKIKALRIELYDLQMELDYQLENEDASLDYAWTVLRKKNQLEYEFDCVEYRYFGIGLSIQLLTRTLKHWESEERVFV